MDPVFHFLNSNPYIYFFLAIPFVIAVQVWFLVRKMSHPEKMLEPLNAITPQEEQVLLTHQNWLQQTNLDYLCLFKFGAIRTVIYRQRGTQRFFSFYFHQNRTSFCVDTCFDDNECVCLTTGTSGSIGMFPVRPGLYQQSFPNVPPETAWQKHLDAEQYLIGRFGIKMQPLSMSYDQLMLKGIVLRMQHVRSIPLYPFLALYWFFVTRSKMANRSVQDQYSTNA